MKRLLTLLACVAVSVTASAQSVVLVGTQLQVTGTDQLDSVTISRFDGDLIAVIANDTDFVFDVFLEEEVTDLVVNLGDGDDIYNALDSVVPAVVNGEAGDDLIFASMGDDRITGGDGDDTIFGYNGDDNINGNDGDDYIDAGGDIDIVRGDDGRDVLVGGAGLDQVIGGDGQDILVGGELDADALAFSGIIETWTFGADDTFDARVADVLNASPVLYNDFELDFISGGKEADLFFDQADEIIVDGVSWPQTAGHSGGGRVDVVIDALATAH